MNLGKLKKLRLERNYTLANISQKTGYTPSFLSQLERGIRLPSLEALRKISECLNVPLLTFFDEGMVDESILKGSPDGDKPEIRESCCVIHKKNRKNIKMPEVNTVYELLTPYSGNSDAGPKLLGLYTRIKSGCWTSENMITHNFEESTYILKGKARAYVKDKVYELEEGDTVYINANVPHNFLNHGEEELILIGYMSKQK